MLGIHIWDHSSESWLYSTFVFFSAVEISPTLSHEKIISAVDAVVQMSGMSFISPNSECLHPGPCRLLV